MRRGFLGGSGFLTTKSTKSTKGMGDGRGWRIRKSRATGGEEAPALNLPAKTKSNPPPFVLFVFFVVNRPKPPCFIFETQKAATQGIFVAILQLCTGKKANN